MFLEGKSRIVLGTSHIAFVMSHGRAGTVLTSSSGLLEESLCVYFANHLSSSGSDLPCRPLMGHGGGLAVWLSCCVPSAEQSLLDRAQTCSIFFLPSPPFLLPQVSSVHLACPFQSGVCRAQTDTSFSSSSVRTQRGGLQLSINCKNQTSVVKKKKKSDGGLKRWLSV